MFGGLSRTGLWVLAATLTGVFSITDAGVQFVLVAVGGLAIGVALSYLLGRLRAWMIARGWEDPAPHVLLLLLLPVAPANASSAVAVVCMHLPPAHLLRL